MNVIQNRIIKKSSLDTLKKDLMKDSDLVKDYLQYTKENPKSNGRWWNFTDLYKEFYVYQFPQMISKKDTTKIKYAKVHYTMIMEKGHNYPIVLSLLYDCGEDTGIETSNIIGRLNIDGNRNDFLNEIYKNGYPSDNNGTYFSARNELINFSDIQSYAIDKLLNSNNVQTTTTNNI